MLTDCNFFIYRGGDNLNKITTVPKNMILKELTEQGNKIN